MKRMVNRNLVIFLLACLIFNSANSQLSKSYNLERDKEKNPILTNRVAQEIVDQYDFIEVSTGKTLRIKDLREKIVVVDFWQTWCAPCIKNFNTLQKAKEKWPDKIEILAASPDWADKPRQIKRFIDRNDYNFIFVYAGDLEKKLELGSIPYKFIIDSEGKLIKSFSGTSSYEHDFELLSKLIDSNFDD